ncbi:MAG: four helix bundle protein [Planctomycetota bacterium]
MKSFDHDRLSVYQKAVAFLIVADEIADELPRGRSYLKDQLHRAAVSILLNIAEGAGEFATMEKARFYRMARRSATESAAVLDACRMLKLAEEARCAAGRSQLLEIVSMLVQMIRNAGGEQDG